MVLSFIKPIRNLVNKSQCIIAEKLFARINYMNVLKQSDGSSDHWAAIENVYRSCRTTSNGQTMNYENNEVEPICSVYAVIH